MLGKAYFEQADYRKVCRGRQGLPFLGPSAATMQTPPPPLPQAEEHFRMSRRFEAHRVEDMEIFSTVLWHLRQETALATLAQEVRARDRGRGGLAALSAPKRRLCALQFQPPAAALAQMTAVTKNAPQVWCVVGNCFSLQREHDNAMLYFERAIQVRVPRQRGTARRGTARHGPAPLASVTSLASLAPITWLTVFVFDSWTPPSPTRTHSLATSVSPTRILQG